VNVALAPICPASRAVSVDKQKFFGRCLLKNGQEATIVAKASSEAEACTKLHAGYTVQMVLELIPEADMPKVWARLKPSLLQRSVLS
jgi:hypothetical protein